MQEKLDKVQKMLDILLFDMSSPLASICGSADLLEEYLKNLSEQGQITPGSIDPNLIITEEMAFEMVHFIQEQAHRLITLQAKTRDEIRSLYTEE